MPAVLREHQHEIATVDETRALLFGTEDTGYLTLVRPVFSGSESRTGDVERPQEDGIMFGRDYLTSKSVTFEIGVLTDAVNLLDAGDPHRANLNHLDTLEGWWRDERLRNRPQALAVLRSHEGGQTWRCYGRPRRYEEAAGKLTESGYTPVVCDFALIDDRYYTDHVDQVVATLVPPPDGGLVAPLVAPLTSVWEASGHTIATIAGARSTWLWVEFVGPVTNPVVEIGGMQVGLVGSIASGMSVTVDPRPWTRGVSRSDGAGLGGWLAGTSPALQDMRLWPGQYDVIYRGIDATASSYATVSWRAARSRP